MSIRIEGGGSKENVIKSGTSNELLYNDEKIFLKKDLLDFVHPVGSIYWSSNDTDPAILFGGTWQQIKDMFVLAAGDIYTNGAKDGAATVTLSVDNMPSHSHETNTLINSSGNTITTTGNQSANPTFSGSHNHRHQIYNSTDTNYPLTYYWDIYSGAKGARYNAGHFYATDDTGYIYTDERTITISGTTVGNHVHNLEHKHGITNTGGLNGIKQSNNNMTTYIDK